MVIAAAIYSFSVPKIWKIDTIIQPGKFLIQTEGGQFEEILATNPKQIAGEIDYKTYNKLIAAELNIDVKKISKLKAENLQNTNLVVISTQNHDVEKAKAILLSLFNNLKIAMDAKVEVEINNIDSKIKSREIQIQVIKKDLDTSKRKLSLVKQRKSEISKEMASTREMIKSLEKAQLSNLNKENRKEAESLGMLLYSNEIQQSLRYHNTLNELLSNKKMEEENLNLAINKTEEQIEEIENQMNNLKQRKGRVDYTQLIKEPTSSLEPVSPNKKLIVIVAFMLSLIFFTFLAFFVEYLKQNKLSRE